MDERHDASVVVRLDDGPRAGAQATWHAQVPGHGNTWQGRVTGDLGRLAHLATILGWRTYTFTTMTTPPTRRSTARGTDRSRETLRILTENITSGRWPLDTRIPTEAELMKQLKVGRSTLREAVSSLTALGMLEPARSRGTFVRSVNPVGVVLSDFLGHHDSSEVLHVRRLIEVEATRLAALNRTDDHLARLASLDRSDFHDVVLEAAGNAFMAQLYSGLMQGVRTSVSRGEIHPVVTDEERQADHARILEAIRDRDPVRAQRAAAEHVDHELADA